MNKIVNYRAFLLMLIVGLGGFCATFGVISIILMASNLTPYDWDFWIMSWACIEGMAFISGSFAAEDN